MYLSQLIDQFSFQVQQRDPGFKNRLIFIGISFRFTFWIQVIVCFSNYFILRIFPGKLNFFFVGKYFSSFKIFNEYGIRNQVDNGTEESSFVG